MSLRDQLRKILKKKKTKSGQAGNIEKKWKYEDCMAFLIPFFKERETIGNVEPEGRASCEEPEADGMFDSSNEETAAASQSQELRKSVPQEARAFSNPPVSGTRTHSVSKKRGEVKETASSLVMKYLLENNEKEKESTSNYSADPIHAFFIGIAATVKQFSPLRQNLAKSKVFSIISSLEYEQIQENMNKMPQSRRGEQAATSSGPTFLASLGAPIVQANEEYQGSEYHQLTANTHQMNSSTSHYLSHTQTPSPTPSQMSGRSSVQAYYEQFSSVDH